MELKGVTAQMESTARAIRDLVEDISDQEARWKPDPESWSILDVVNHLVYEEDHDFRARLNLALHQPDATWPTGASARGVTEGGRERAPDEAVQAFLSARRSSLAWLDSLERPDWEAACEAPFGEIRAGDILWAWAAHDLLHLRQLIELRWALTTRKAAPYQVRYAGRW